MFGPLWAPPIGGGGPWGGQRRLRDNGGLPGRKRGCVPAVRCDHDCDGALSSNECHCCEEARQSDDRELASGTHVRNLAKLRGTDAAGPIRGTFDLPQSLPDSRAGQVGLKAYVGPRIPWHRGAGSRSSPGSPTACTRSVPTRRSRALGLPHRGVQGGTTGGPAWRQAPHRGRREPAARAPGTCCVRRSGGSSFPRCPRSSSRTSRPASFGSCGQTRRHGLLAACRKSRNTTLAATDPAGRARTRWCDAGRGTGTLRCRPPSQRRPTPTSQITMRYAHLAPDHLRAAVASLHGVLGPVSTEPAAGATLEEGRLRRKDGTRTSAEVRAR